jgi:(2Fe-2S) ferredoxin
MLTFFGYAGSNAVSDPIGVAVRGPRRRAADDLTAPAYSGPVRGAGKQRMIMESKATQKAGTLGLGATRRHIFLCVRPANQSCCSGERAAASWERLKDRLKALGLSELGGIQRTKADCLRICAEGPVAVVYPEGVWYGRCTPENIDRIIAQHLVEGRVVEELRITGPVFDARSVRDITT